MNKLTVTLIIFCIYFLLQLNFGCCQTEQQNLNKYFAYRNWFKTRFIKIGPLAGESLPIENRLIDPNNIANKKIRWGDATVHLGFYMATLATEYKLYMDDNNFEKANETLNELYYAVVALNRIDDVAENYHNATITSAVRNGFFLRDDVPLSFLSNFQNATVEGPIAGWYPLYNSGNPIPGQPYEYNFNDINSDFYFKDGAPNTTAPLFYSPENEASQDQVIALLMGFCFMKQYIPNSSVSPRPGVDPPLNLITEITQFVTNFYSRVTAPATFYRDVTLFKGKSYEANLLLNIDENWVIMNYNNSKVVHRGADMIGFSDALNSVMNQITSGNQFPAFTILFHDGCPPLPGTPCPPVGCFIPPGASATVPLSTIGGIFNSLQSSPSPEALDDQEVCVDPPIDFVCLPFPDLSTVSLNTDANRWMTFTLAALKNSWGAQNFFNLAQSADMEIFDLVRSAKNSVQPVGSQSFFENILNSAPINNTPYGTSGITDWSSTNRWIHTDPDYTGGEYNGLDYMLFHNLYRIVFKNNLTQSYNNTGYCENPTNIYLLAPFVSNVLPAPNPNYPTKKFNQLTVLRRQFPDYKEKGVEAMDYFGPNNFDITDPNNLKVLTDISYCTPGMKLRVQKPGLIEIGDGTIANSGSIIIANDAAIFEINGDIIINKGSKIVIEAGLLIIKSGSRITLNDDARLIKKPGAQIIWEPNSEVYLAGENTLIDIQGTSTVANYSPHIFINSSQQFYCSRSSASLIGGTIKFAGGDFTLNAGGGLINDGCKIIMQPAMNFSYQPNSLIQLSQTCSEIRVLNPNTTITIPSGDQFYTTKDGSAEGGLIYFAGGEFDLLAGGTINNDGCKIQLGNGMNLDYYQGSNIDLTGSFAMLYVDGTLHLHPNADFHFNNDGFIKFGLPNAAPNILSDASCTLTFTGQGASDKVLEIADQTDLFLDHTTGLLKIQDAKVELGYQSSVNVANPVDFTHSRFTSANLSYTANGLVFNGQSRLHLDHLDVDYMKYGIRARNFYSDGADFKLTNSAIGYCDYGLQTWDKGASLTNVNVHDCYNWGWQGFGMTRPSPVLLSKFNRTQQFGGVYYEGAGSNLLRISYCEINNNAAVGLAIAGPALATVLCSELKDNLDGNPSFVAVPYVCNAAIQFNASLNFSPLSLSHTLGGYNDFSSVSNPYNTTHSVLSTWGWSNVYSSNNGGAAFYLEGGHNSFTKDADFKFASGTFGQAGNFPGNKLYAKNNQWYANLSPPNSAEYSLTSNSNAHPITISDPTPEYFDGCRMVPVDPNGVDGRPYPLYECPRCPVINSPRFNLVPLNQALLQAIDTTTLADTANGNDLTAFQMLYDISRVCILHDAEDVAFLFKLAYSFMKAAFGSAVKDSLINSVNDPEFSMLAEFQGDLINRAIENDNDYEEYYYTLDRAFSYLAVNDREEALAVLNGLSPCIELTEEQYAFLDHWKNLVNVENNILTGQQSIFDFDSLLEAGGNGYGSRMFFTGTKANIDTIMFDSIPFPAVQSLQSITDNNGNVYTVSAQADSSMNYLLTRTDSLSQVLWSYPYDGRNHDSDIVKALCVDGLGNIYVTGKSWNRDNFEVTTVKFDSAGNQYWTAVYNSPDYLNDEPTGMEINPDGKLVITGKSSNDTIERFFRIEYSQCDTFCLPGYRSATQPPETSIEFSLSPNPVTDGYLRIDYKLQAKENGQFEIYDLAGRQLYRLLLPPNSTSQHIKLPISANGIYYAAVASGGKKISRKLAILLE